jgi:hypothetical protein
MGREYAFKRYTVFNEPPHGKDYNENLKALRAQESREAHQNQIL